MRSEEVKTIIMAVVGCASLILNVFLAEKLSQRFSQKALKNYGVLLAFEERAYAMSCARLVAHLPMRNPEQEAPLALQGCVEAHYGSDKEPYNAPEALRKFAPPGVKAYTWDENRPMDNTLLENIRL